MLAGLLSINLLQSPVQATITNSDQTFSGVNLTVTSSAVAIYLGYNYLVRKDNLVKNTHPIAQIWYDAMTKKYSAAHLDLKAFVQKPKFGMIMVIRALC